ncbi:MAG: hypothetical protein IJ889_01050 [Eubacterium sp.]|nr:hypothetical protein [Eubacterium sp.]MBR2247348.1 hypothetical protein [Bacilli bacterium]
MNTVAEAKTKSLPLSEYINRMKNLGFEDDQIQGMIMSLVKRGDIAIEPTKSIVRFLRYEIQK